MKKCAYQIVNLSEELCDSETEVLDVWEGIK